MSSGQNKNKIPSSCYISKIVEFFRFHYRKGKLFMDYKKEGCKGISKTSVRFVKRINLASLYQTGFHSQYQMLKIKVIP